MLLVITNQNEARDVELYRSTMCGCHTDKVLDKLARMMKEDESMAIVAIDSETGQYREESSETIYFQYGTRLGLQISTIYTDDSCASHSHQQDRYDDAGNDTLLTLINSSRSRRELDLIFGPIVVKERGQALVPGELTKA